MLLTKRWLMGLVVVILPLTSNSQSDSSVTSPKKLGDTLSFRILKVVVDSSKKEEKTTIRKTSVTSELRYDFRSQYPWYQTGSKEWLKDETYQLEFTRLPSTGWIYLYSVDGANDVREHGIIQLDSLKRPPFLYPDSLKNFAFDAEGADQLVLWYTPDSIAGVGRLIQGIELTTGDFVKRNNRQINRDLVLPAYGWHMLDTDFGFATNPQLFSFAARSILPVIVRFDVVASKPPGKKAPKR